MHEEVRAIPFNPDPPQTDASIPRENPEISRENSTHSEIPAKIDIVGAKNCWEKQDEEDKIFEVLSAGVRGRATWAKKQSKTWRDVGCKYVCIYVYVCVCMYVG